MKLNIKLPNFCVLALLFACLGSYCRASAQCQVEGPSIKDTSDYIEKAMHASDEKFELAWDMSDGTFEYYDGQSGTDSRGYPYSLGVTKPERSVKIYDLDCSMYSSDEESAFVICKIKYYCVEKKREFGTSSSGFSDRFDIEYEGDVEVTARLARALSHLVYLLQQKYKVVHAANPNDPFAH